MREVTQNQSLRALNGTILLIAGLQAGIGPFLAIYLKSLHWNPYQIGIAFGSLNLAAMLVQIPSGLLIDALKIKRLLLGLSCFIIAASSLLISLLHHLYFIIALQFLIGMATAIIPQAITAITLGLVGRKKFPKRTSTNETLSHLGNIILALLAGLCAYLIGNTWILYIYAIFSLSALVPLSTIKGTDINHAIARHLPEVINPKDSSNHIIVPIKRLIILPANIIFLLCIFIFHFSSAAQLTLVSQLYVQINPKIDTIFLAVSLIVTHLVMMFVAFGLRFYIKGINRKPLFSIIFLFVFIRGLLFTISQNPYFMVALQVLDGLSGGLFGVISIVILSELTTNSGRFNFMHGLMALCQGMAYALSNIISGYIANLYSYNAGFYVLASLAMFGFFICLLFMPETYKKHFF